MRYLTAFRPSKDLEEDLKKEPNVILPRSWLHCTLVNFAAPKPKERTFVETLLNVRDPRSSVPVESH